MASPKKKRIGSLIGKKKGVRPIKSQKVRNGECIPPKGKEGSRFRWGTLKEGKKENRKRPDRREKEKIRPCPCEERDTFSLPLKKVQRGGKKNEMHLEGLKGKTVRRADRETGGEGGKEILNLGKEGKSLEKRKRSMHGELPEGISQRLKGKESGTRDGSEIGKRRRKKLGWRTRQGACEKGKKHRGKGRRKGAGGGGGGWNKGQEEFSERREGTVHVPRDLRGEGGERGPTDQIKRREEERKKTGCLPYALCW